MVIIFGIYKGKSEKIHRKIRHRLNLLSFLARRSNQLDSFTRLLHFYSCFWRYPYWPHFMPYGHMAKWPYGHFLRIWPYGQINIWHKMASIWVSLETAIQIQQSGEGIELIRPSGKKWEQIWSDGEFSYVFFRTFLCIYQKWWPQLILALKLTKFFLVAHEV